jgi:hypothetical protein
MSSFCIRKKLELDTFVLKVFVIFLKLFRHMPLYKLWQCSCCSQKLEQVARVVRGNNSPFGGLQLILCGDFLQLPPVMQDTHQKGVRFCFQSPAWEKCVHVSFELTQVHRQSDPVFIEILQNVRIGRWGCAVTDYWLLLQGGIIQCVPSTVAISDLLCIPIWVLIRFIPQCSLVAPETSSNEAGSWWEMSLNLAYEASLSYYAKFFNMP